MHASTSLNKAIPLFNINDPSNSITVKLLNKHEIFNNTFRTPFKLNIGTRHFLLQNNFFSCFS